MTQVGKTDVFERLYMEKFRSLAANFGEFVTYERDRGARDIGLHLTRRLSSGKERLSSALCWFQMKGLMASTLPKREYDAADEVKLSLSVEHLRYWYLQPMPTYLVVYVQSVDTFLIQDIQAYVAATWGKAIFSLDQASATVSIPKGSILDEQAFRLLLTKSDISDLVKALETDKKSAGICRRDYNLIWHIGTAQDRRVEHRIVYWNWQSKTRDQFFIQERELHSRGEWKVLREHWQLQRGSNDLEAAYPYINFFALEQIAPKDGAVWLDKEDDDCWPIDGGDEFGLLNLPNGDVIAGEDVAGEYIEFVLGARLNDLGNQLFEFVSTLIQMGLIEIKQDMNEWLSVAPWNHRAI